MTRDQSAAMFAWITPMSTWRFRLLSQSRLAKLPSTIDKDISVARENPIDSDSSLSWRRILAKRSQISTSTSVQPVKFYLGWFSSGFILDVDYEDAFAFVAAQGSVGHGGEEEVVDWKNFMAIVDYSLVAMWK